MTALVADVLLVAGLVVVTLGVFGVVRLPDLAMQLHAASKAAFLGVSLLLAGAAVRGGGAVAARAVLIVIVLAVATPVAAHAVARAAHRRDD